MKTVAVLIDHPNLDYLLVPVIEKLLRSGRIRIVTFVCNAGKNELLISKKISYHTDINYFSEFLNSPGKKLFLNAADMNFSAHQLGRRLDDLCREKGIPSLTLEHGSGSLRETWPKEFIFNADRMALFGTCEFDKYQLLGVDSNKLVITGCSKYDEYYYLDREKSIRENRSLLNLEAKRRYILLAGENHRFTAGPLKYSDKQWTGVLKNIFEILIKSFPDLDIIVKPHPAEPYNQTISLYENAIEPEFRSRINHRFTLFITPCTFRFRLCAILFSFGHARITSVPKACNFVCRPETSGSNNRMSKSRCFYYSIRLDRNL